MPTYLDSQSATGGLLQGLPSQTAYTPGQGQAPISNESFPGLGAAITSATDASGRIDWPMLQRLSGMSSQQLQSVRSGGTLSALPGQGAAALSSPGSPQPGGGFATTGPYSGDGNMWFGSDPFAGLQGIQSGDTGSGVVAGGGGGGGGGTGGGTGTGSAGQGLNLSGIAGGLGNANGGNPALTNFSTPIAGTLNYQDPNSPNAVQGQPGVLQMQQANPQSAIDAYKNTAGYQLLNDPNAYQQSPGYQYAMDQAMGQVQNSAAGRGMLESGAVLKQMQQTASGLAQQDYGNWWNRQNQLYGDYQNRLQGLAGGPTGSQDAMTAAANQAQLSAQTGSNLGSLFGNQGTAGMGGIINTGAAQSGNMTNAGQQQANVNSTNQSTLLAGATLAGNNMMAKPQGFF